MSSFVLWLIIVCGQLSVVAKVSAVLGSVGVFGTLIVCGIVSFVLDNDAEEYAIEKAKAIAIKAKKYIKYWILLVLLAVCVPSTKEAAAIYVLPKIVNAAVESELPETFENLAIKWCEKQAEEMKDKCTE